VATSHIILGLNIGWQNLTETPIKIMEIQVVLYKPKHDDILRRLLPLERFGRQDIQRTLLKTPLSQFILKPKEIHTEHIRFISHQSLNLAPGTYVIGVQIRDNHHTSYTRRTRIVVENKMKYHLQEDWQQTAFSDR
jgi:hypothetical protein